jgi:hypothetical protein
MKDHSEQLEFGIASVEDIRCLLKAWHRIVVRERLESSESSLVHIIVEDRRPGEEVLLVFQAAQEVLHRFLQTLKDMGVKFSCHPLIPGILTLCRITKKRGILQVIDLQRGDESSHQ